MEAIESVLSLIVTLGILVTIHEFGHYWVAKRCGVKVLKFSVGFGKSLYSWKNSAGTEFCIAAIPLGGYVKMLDEREATVAESERSLAFNNKSVSQRIAIASAGPIANFLFAIVAYWAMFSLGYSVVKPVIGSVAQGSIAEQAGLESGLEITAVADRTTAGWRDVNISLVNFVGESTDVSLRAQSSGQPSTEKEYTLRLDEWLRDSNQKNLIESLGLAVYRPTVPAVLAVIVEDSPAQLAGFTPGDKVLSVNGESITDWFDLVSHIESAADKNIEVLVQRDAPSGSSITVTLRPTPAAYETEDGLIKGRLGVGPAPFSYPEDMIRVVKFGPYDALLNAADQTWADTTMTLGAIKKMLVGLMSLDNLSGPITIAQVASQSISSGVESFLSFLALLSVSLGVLNLLPIPVLDGGHILYCLMEAVRGKPVPESWQVIGLKIGVSFVIVLMAIAFYNDIMRL